MNKTLYFFIAFLAIFNFKNYGQEALKVSQNANDSFIVIVNINEQNNPNIVREIKKAASSLNIRYLGYCSNQYSIIISASSTIYPNLQRAVLEVLRKQYGRNAIVDFNRKESIQNFCKECQFSSPEEYKYFKITYGK